MQSEQIWVNLSPARLEGIQPWCPLPEGLRLSDGQAEVSWCQADPKGWSENGALRMVRGSSPARRVWIVDGASLMTSPLLVISYEAPLPGRHERHNIPMSWPKHAMSWRLNGWNVVEAGGHLEATALIIGASCRDSVSYWPGFCMLEAEEAEAAALAVPELCARIASGIGQEAGKPAGWSIWKMRDLLSAPESGIAGKGLLFIGRQSLLRRCRPNEEQACGLAAAFRAALAGQEKP